MEKHSYPNNGIYKQHDRLETYSMAASMYMLSGTAIFYVLNFLAVATGDESYFETGGVIAISTAVSGLLAVLALDVKARSVNKNIDLIEEKEKQALVVREEQLSRLLLLVLASDIRGRWENTHERLLSTPEFYNLLQSMPSSLDIDLLSETINSKGD